MLIERQTHKNQSSPLGVTKSRSPICIQYNTINIRTPIVICYDHQASAVTSIVDGWWRRRRCSRNTINTREQWSTGQWSCDCRRSTVKSKKSTVEKKKQKITPRDIMMMILKYWCSKWSDGIVRRKTRTNRHVATNQLIIIERKRPCATVWRSRRWSNRSSINIYTYIRKYIISRRCL